MGDLDDNRVIGELVRRVSRPAATVTSRAGTKRRVPAGPAKSSAVRASATARTAKKRAR
jgi:hypothetical protein